MHTTQTKQVLESSERKVAAWREYAGSVQRLANHLRDEHALLCQLAELPRRVQVVPDRDVWRVHVGILADRAGFVWCEGDAPERVELEIARWHCAQGGRVEFGPFGIVRALPATSFGPVIAGRMFLRQFVTVAEAVLYVLGLHPHIPPIALPGPAPEAMAFAATGAATTFTARAVPADESAAFSFAGALAKALRAPLSKEAGALLDALRDMLSDSNLAWFRAVKPHIDEVARLAARVKPDEGLGLFARFAELFRLTQPPGATETYERLLDVVMRLLPPELPADSRAALEGMRALLRGVDLDQALQDFQDLDDPVMRAHRDTLAEDEDNFEDDTERET